MKRLIFAALLLCIIFAANTQAKRVSILGDSYSTFQYYVEPAANRIWYYEQPRTDMTDVDDVSQTWWHLFITENGHTLEKNNSYSGATVCTTGYKAKDYTDRAFITRMSDLGNPEILFIFGGTNDAWAGSPIGEWDWDGDAQGDFTAFRPALCRMLSWLKKRHPNTDIIYLVNDGLKPEITSSIIEACKHYGIRYIELQGIEKVANHPNRRGMRQIADQIPN